MFSLIISIISIALVAALAAATVYFGGSAFNKGTAGADASTLINAGQQVAGAYALAKNDGLTVTSMSTLTPAYVAQVPTFKSSVFALDDTAKTAGISGLTANNTSIISDAVCKEVESRATGTTVTTVPTAKSANLFGCYVAGTGATATNTFFYKYDTAAGTPAPVTP